jgi:hypothetical protein
VYLHDTYTYTDTDTDTDTDTGTFGLCRILGSLARV